MEYSDYLKANDTMFYYDFDRQYAIQSVLENSVSVSPWNETDPNSGAQTTQKRIKTLLNMVMSKFAMWQVWTLHSQLFLDSMLRVFNAYERYYAEKILAYETQIDFLDGTKITTTHDGDLTETPRVEVMSETYDLPRSDSSINRPSTRVVSKPVTGTNATHDEYTDIRKGGNVIDLKKKYLDLLRSVYEEFADKFRVNFLEMFDYEFVEG